MLEDNLEWLAWVITSSIGATVIPTTVGTVHDCKKSRALKFEVSTSASISRVSYHTHTHICGGLDQAQVFGYNHDCGVIVTYM